MVPSLFAVLLSLVSAVAPGEEPAVALVGGTVLTAPGATPIENGTVLVRDGRVLAIGADMDLPADARAIDCRGLTITAALVDAAAGLDIDFPDHALMQGRPIDDGRDTLSAMVDGNRRGLAPDRDVATALAPDGTDLEDHRAQGFGSLLVSPGRQLLAGSGAWLVPNGLPAREALLGRGPQFGSLTWRGSPGDYSGTAYPATLMGVMAHLRQMLLDGRHHHQLVTRFAEGRSRQRPPMDAGLAALAPLLTGEQPLVLRADTEEDIRLALDLAENHGLSLILAGGREAWELADELALRGVPVILDMDFPDEPDAPEEQDDAAEDDAAEDQAEEDAGRRGGRRAGRRGGRRGQGGGPAGRAGRGAAAADDDELPDRLANGQWPAPRPYGPGDHPRVVARRHADWVERISGAAVLIEAGVPVAFGSFDEDPASLRQGVATAIEKGGLDRELALAALTTGPARVLGGAAPRGELVVGGPATVAAWKGAPLEDGSELAVLVLESVVEDLRPAAERWEAFEPEQDGDDEASEEDQDDASDETEDDDADEPGDEGRDLVDAAPAEEEPAAQGDGQSAEQDDDGDESGDEHDGPLAATPFQVALAAAERAADPDVWPPVELDEDRQPALRTDGDLLIRDATLHTLAEGGALDGDGVPLPGGVLPGFDLLVVDGRIAQIGRDLQPGADTTVIGGEGWHVMPGVLDAHSHIAIRGGVNEWTRNITPEVTIEDEVDPDDVNIYRALAGGTTSARLLHGSANAIGGRHEVIKLRWGEDAPGMVFEGAPAGVKFALGENPRQANWGSGGRFPKTRMGVAASIRRAFEAGQDYAAAMARHEAARDAGQDPDPVRRDLRLEALAGILAGDIAIHSHCYRAHEILMLIEVAEAFGVQVATFQHVLEGYKVAREIGAHGGLGCSTFIDWWGFKFEAYDAIPFNPALVHEAGVMMSINSDSADHIRRLNFEAAKAVKYGGVPEQAAMQMVTLTPAVQLGLGERIGTLEQGKDADFAIYDGHPFDTASKVLFTVVDGEVRFQRREGRYQAWEDELARRIAAGRAALADLPELPGPTGLAARDRQVDPAHLEALAEEPQGTRAASTPDRPVPGKVVLVGGVVHTMERDEQGEPIVHDPGVVILEGGRIVSVAPGDWDVPEAARQGVEVRDISGSHVWPGLVDGGSTVGLGEISMVQQSMDVNETGGDQPDVRVSMGWHPDSETIPVARANGITTTLVEPGGGGLRGQSAVLALEGWTVSEALVLEGAGLHVAAPRTRRGDGRRRPGEAHADEEQAQVHHLCLTAGIHDHAGPQAEPLAGRPDPDELREDIDASWAGLTDWLDQARRYVRRRGEAAAAGRPGPEHDARLEAVAPYALGQRPIVFHCDRADQIADALDFIDREGLSGIIAGGREAWKVADRLALSGVPVLLGPVIAMPMGRDECYDSQYTNPGILHRAGVPFGFRSGSNHGARDLPYHAGMAVAFGLDRDAAHEALTVGAARALGLEDELGSIRTGLRADLLITDGDPLQITTSVQDVIIGGRSVGTDSKHTRLYERYRARLRDPGRAHLR